MYKITLPPYDEITTSAGKFTTGDILICSGAGSLSKGIRKYQEVSVELGLISHKEIGVQSRCEANIRCSFSHVAAIGGGGMVAEATTLNSWATGADGKPKRGYQMNPYRLWIDNYDGHVWARKLIPPEKWLYDYRSELTMFDEAMLGTPYENGIPGTLELLFCGIEMFHNQAVRRMRTKEIHCTESVANKLKRVDILSNAVRSNKVPPCMWGPGGYIDQKLINGFKLGPLIEIK